LEEFERGKSMNRSGSAGKPKLTNRQLWSQLSNAISLRSSEDQVLWTISGIFWAANALLLVALFQGGRLPDTYPPRFVIASVGVVLATIQYFLQGRALGHIRRYEELIKRLELALHFDDEYAVSADLNDQDADRYLGGQKGNILRKVRMGTLLPVRKLMQFTSCGAGLVWLGALGFFVYATICSN